jgi:cation transport ATPase
VPTTVLEWRANTEQSTKRSEKRLKAIREKKKRAKDQKNRDRDNTSFLIGIEITHRVWILMLGDYVTITSSVRTASFFLCSLLLFYTGAHMIPSSFWAFWERSKTELVYLKNVPHVNLHLCSSFYYYF